MSGWSRRIPTRIAGDPGLGDLELGLADAVAVADADLGVRQAVDGQVLPELAVAEVVPAEVILPMPVGLDLVDEHGPHLAAVSGGVALAVAVDVEPAHQPRPGNGALPDAGVHGAAVPRHVRGHPDVQRYQLRQDRPPDRAVGCRPGHPVAPTGSITSSAAIGSSRTRRPVAWNTAFAIAAADTDLADLADALDAERIDDVVVTSTNSTVTSGASAFTGTRYSPRLFAAHLPGPRVHLVALEQRLADAPEHAAHQLAARELRVEHPAGREHAEHPADPDEPEIRVDGDLGELGAERQQPVRRVQRRRRPAAERLRVEPAVALQQVGVAVADAGRRGQDQATVLDLDRGRVGAVQRRLLVGDRHADQLIAQRDRGVVHGRADHPGAGRPDRRRGVRQIGVAGLEPHAVDGRAPEPSAATWVIAVVAPVPNSCVLVCTTALPSE